VIFRKKQDIPSGSLSLLAWRRFKKSKPGMISLGFILCVTFMALLGYLVTPDGTPFSNEQYLELGLKKPGFRVTCLEVRKEPAVRKTGFLKKMILGAPSTTTLIPVKTYEKKDSTVFYEEYSEKGNPQELSIKSIPEKELMGIRVKRFWLGSDRFGRDYLSQLMIGARVSLSVGFISVFISLVIGMLVGAIGGYYRGWIDQVIVWFINVIWSIPTLLLVIAITFALGKGFWQVFIAVGLTMWVEVARVVRGQVLSVREKEYVEAGRALGFSDFRIITRHVIPNVMAAVIIISAANFASAILMEAGLSFLGLGVQPPVPSWGSMMKENYGYIVLDYAYLAVLPGIAIMLLVLAFMLIGNSLRDAMDVKSSEI
jgi:peptide/nickel transport system permease protein